MNAIFLRRCAMTPWSETRAPALYTHLGTLLVASKNRPGSLWFPDTYKYSRVRLTCQSGLGVERRNLSILV